MMNADLQPRILVVDDQLQVRETLAAMLQSRYRNVCAVESAERAAAKLEAGEADVVILDVNMPGASGLDLLDMAQRWHWDAAFILASGKPEVDGIVSAMRLRAADFLIKPVRKSAVVQAVDTAFADLISARASRKHHATLQATLENRTVELQLAVGSLEQSYSDTLISLTTALDAREHATCSHSFRVRAYTSYLAQMLGYPEKDLKDLENAALLHD